MGNNNSQPQLQAANLDNSSQLQLQYFNQVFSELKSMNQKYTDAMVKQTKHDMELAKANAKILSLESKLNLIGVVGLFEERCQEDLKDWISKSSSPKNRMSGEKQMKERFEVYLAMNFRGLQTKLNEYFVEAELNPLDTDGITTVLNGLFADRNSLAHPNQSGLFLEISRTKFTPYQRAIIGAICDCVPVTLEIVE